MLISIVMPVYNSSLTLNRSIESIINQTNSNWELICVDDGSIDNSLSILQSFQKKDHRIKVYHKDNSGPGLTRNFAIEKCNGEYIGFLDSDDCWDILCVEELLKLIESNNPDVIILRTIMCNKNNFYDAFKVNKFINLKNKDLISCMMSGILPWGQEKVIKASIIKNNHIKFSKDSVGEEAIFSFDVLNNSKLISFVNQPMYYYYVDEKGQHKKGNQDPWFNVVLNMKSHLIEKELFEEYETSLNSLAVRALIICIYRICISENNYKEAKTKIKNKIYEYAKLYKIFKYKSKSLDFKSKLLLLIL